MSIAILLIALALVFTVASAAGKAPLWPAVFCVVLERLLAVVPLR